MAHVICIKVAGKIGRIRLESTSLDSKVSDFRQRVCGVIGDQETSEKINLIYCGRLLKDGDTLQDSGVKPGCTIHVLKKREADEEPKLEPMGDGDIIQLMTALHAALLNPSHRQAVHKILTSAETIDNIIAATPGMSADHIAVSMLRDPQLLVQVADPENVRSIVWEHPAIGHAVMNIAASVNEEAAHSARSSNLLNQDSSFALVPDLAMGDDMDTSEAGSSSSQGQGLQRGITAAQLSAALNAAGVGRGSDTAGDALPQSGFLRPYVSSDTHPGGGEHPPSTSGTTAGTTAGTTTQTIPGTVASGSGGSRITTDLFQQALAQAMETSHGEGASEPTANRETSSQPPDYSEQLQQLKDMGISDHALSLRALQATEGNVGAALHLIFEGDIN